MMSYHILSRVHMIKVGIKFTDKNISALVKIFRSIAAVNIADLPGVKVD